MNEPVLIPKALYNACDKYREALFAVSGYDPMTAKRNRVYVCSRIMLAYKLLEDGYTETQVGTVIGKEHSTVHFYKTRMEDFLKFKAYSAERSIWLNFLKYLKEQENENEVI